MDPMYPGAKQNGKDVCMIRTAIINSVRTSLHVHVHITMKSIDDTKLQNLRRASVHVVHRLVNKFTLELAILNT